MVTSSSKTRFRVIAVLTAISLLAAACGDDDDAGGTATAASEASDTTEGSDTTEASETTASETTAPADVEVDRSAEFRWAHSFGHNSFDPHRSPNAPGDSAWLRPVYDRLLTLVRGPDGGVEVGPQLATSFEIAEDGLSIELELRDDVTFQDGTPFNGEAVRANVERAKDPESTVSSLLAAVDSVEVVDDTHVVFDLNQPYPGLPYSLAADTIGMMVSPAAFETDLSTTPVGAGPFKLVSAVRDAEVVYERWEDHWDPDAALVSRLTIATVSDANARFNAVRTGEYDAAYMSQPLDVQSRELEDEGFQWVQELAPISQGVLINTTMEPFDDVRVRQAVSMAMNRQEISEQLLGGLAPPMYQVFAEGYLGHDPALDVDPYDPDAAQALVREAGAEGATVTLLAIATPPYDSIAQIAQQALGDIGLNVEVETVSPTEAIPTWLEGSYPFFIGTILAEPEPSLSLTRSYLGGHNHGEPPAELVEMANTALTSPLGSDEREQAYQEISGYLAENPIHLPLVPFSTVVLASPQVVGAKDLAKVVIGKLDFRGVGLAAP